MNSNTLQYLQFNNDVILQFWDSSLSFHFICSSLSLSETLIPISDTQLIDTYNIYTLCVCVCMQFASYSIFLEQI